MTDTDLPARLPSGPFPAGLLLSLLAALGPQGEDDVAWSEGVGAPEDAETFAREAIWVICNSGMKHAVARLIQSRVMSALEEGRPVSEAFGHRGKAQAMQDLWDRRDAHLAGFNAAADKLAYLETLPWIGSITKFHLAKNLGIDCAKPDVHLVRIAERCGEDVHGMCARLAEETGLRRSTVDLVIWRACATGLLDSRTGGILRLRES